MFDAQNMTGTLDQEAATDLMSAMLAGSMAVAIIMWIVVFITGIDDCLYVEDF